MSRYVFFSLSLFSLPLSCQSSIHPTPETGTFLPPLSIKSSYCVHLHFPVHLNFSSHLFKPASSAVCTTPSLSLSVIHLVQRRGLVWVGILLSTDCALQFNQGYAPEKTIHSTACSRTKFSGLVVVDHAIYLTSSDPQNSSSAITYLSSACAIVICKGHRQQYSFLFCQQKSHQILLCELQDFRCDQ